MIYDFGYAKKIDNNIHYITNLIAEDYSRIIGAFMNKKIGGWINRKNLPKDITNNKFYEIITKITYMAYTQYPIPKQKNLFANIINNIFLIYTPPGMFITQRPSNIINDTPFRID